MEFIPGNDLAELLELRGSPFPVEQVLGWADKLLKALEYLHGKGVIHRDIKPSNLKLTRTGEIFLLDFGLAKGAVGQMSTLTTSRSNVGGRTLNYASLEQLYGQKTDARSDLYSLGATLSHLLTAERPIDAATRNLAVNDEDPDPLRLVHELNPQVSPAVSAIIHQAMAISRKRRPESAAEMRRLLSEASSTAASLVEEEKAKQRALEERRQREAEEERQRADEAAEARRRRKTINAEPPVMPLTDDTKQPTPVFHPTDIKNSSHAGKASGTVGRIRGKSKWLLLAAATFVLVLIVVIVVRTMTGTTDVTNSDSTSPAPGNGNGNVNASPSPTPKPTPVDDLRRPRQPKGFTPATSKSRASNNTSRGQPP